MGHRRVVHAQYGGAGVGRVSVTRKGKNEGWLSQLLFGLSLVFLAAGLFILAWAVWPTPTDSAQFTIPAGVLPGAPADSGYASQAEYILSVDWPTRLRMGQAGILRTTLVETDKPTSAPAERPAQAVLVEPAIGGVALDPPGLVQTNLAAGQGLVLTWDIDPVNEGEHTGKVYVSFGFYDEAEAEQVAVPVAVVDVSVSVTSLWGLDSQLALWFGFVGLVLWGALFVLGRVVQGRP